MNLLSENHPFVFFKNNNYLVVRNLIANNLCDFFYDYIKLSFKRLQYIEQKYGFGNYDETRYGTFRDNQALGDLSQYGDLVFDTLLQLLTKKINFLTNISLIPTYSYYRFYTTNTELKKHIDRESCEISMTLCLGCDTTNLNFEYNWPMFIKNQNNKEVPIYLKPGDAIIYKGCVLEHWREPFKGINHAQVFLHYNDKDGKFKNLYDNRPELGLPISFKKQNI